MSEGGTKKKKAPLLTAEQLKNLGKPEILHFAREAVAALTDSDAEIVAAAGYSEEELAHIFKKASEHHNAIAEAKERLENIDHQKQSSDVFWVVWALKLENRIQAGEQSLSRISAAINTRALLRANREPRP
jgi:hypothetical protein